MACDMLIFFLKKICYYMRLYFPIVSLTIYCMIRNGQDVILYAAAEPTVGQPGLKVPYLAEKNTVQVPAKKNTV